MPPLELSVPADYPAQSPLWVNRQWQYGGCPAGRASGIPPRAPSAEALLASSLVDGAGGLSGPQRREAPCLPHPCRADQPAQGPCEAPGAPSQGQEHHISGDIPPWARGWPVEDWALRPSLRAVPSPAAHWCGSWHLSPGLGGAVEGPGRAQRLTAAPPCRRQPLPAVGAPVHDLTAAAAP